MALPLTVTDLRVKTPQGRQLLTIPQLSIAPGTLLGIAGPSGAGKSTLLFALSGLLAFTGSVCWGDVDLGTLGRDARTAFRARHMGLIFQDFLLFDELSAQSNAQMAALFAPAAARHAIADKAAAHLRLLGLSPDPRPVASCSGGERQRIAIARALASDPAILLADEPTAALDQYTAERLIRDLVALARAEGKTLIAVSHDARLLDVMDRVLIMQDGRLQAGSA